MSAGGESLAHGRYTITYNSLAIGITGGTNGVPHIHNVLHGIPINNTDRYGSSKIDGIYRGEDFHIAMILKEWKAAERTMLYPFNTWGLMGVIGDSFFAYAKELVLTAVVGTPAATAGPATLTASKAVIPPGHRTVHSMGPVERDSPISLDLLPFDTGAGVNGWFTWT